MSSPNTDGVVSQVGREYLRLHLARDIGPILSSRLIEHFGSPTVVLAASKAELEHVNGIGRRGAESIIRARDDTAADREIERAEETGARIICIKDADYPALLRNITDPPTCIYVRGLLEPTDAVAIAIVGTRRCSHYGREQAIRFGRALGSAGFTVVSGLARGIDGDAHRGALQGSGRTIAVLGGGLATIYPREHESLADEIAAGHGAVISEYRIDAEPEGRNFPSRNRIITGLSLGVLVIEAGKRSGALITARLASEYNREVFAIPGRVDQPELTAGVHRLIRESQAKLVTCLDDILDEFSEVGEIMHPDRTSGDRAGGDRKGEEDGTPVTLPKLTAPERAVFEAVANGIEDAERIRAIARLSMGQVTSTLTALQLKGLVTSLPGNRFVRRTPEHRL